MNNNNTEPEANWHEELKDLIQVKKIENLVLKKVSESVLTREPPGQETPDNTEQT